MRVQGHRSQIPEPGSALHPHLSTPSSGDQLFVVVLLQLLSHAGLCDLMDYSTPGPPILHCLPEFAQIHVQSDDAI